MARVAKGAALTPTTASDERAGADPITAATRHVALLAALLATAGSLFFSEVLGWVPCELCWIQRILMYPIAAILLIGILRDDRGLHWYVLPLSLAGMGVSLFHFLQVLQVIPPSDCAGGVPCSIDYLAPYFTGAWSFIRIPSLAFAAFTIISVMMGNYAVAGAPGYSAAGRRTARVGAVVLLALVVVLFFAGAALL